MKLRTFNDKSSALIEKDGSTYLTFTPTSVNEVYAEEARKRIKEADVKASVQPKVLTPKPSLGDLIVKEMARAAGEVA